MLSQPPIGRLVFRPTCETTLPLPRSVVLERLQAGLTREDPDLHVRWGGDDLLLALPERRRHFWSAWLFVDVRGPESEDGEDTEDAGSSGPDDAEPTTTEGDTCRVVTRFSPSPQLWTGLMLAYIGLATVVLVFTCFAVAQMGLGRTPWAWWLVGGAVALAGLLWLGAQAGQLLARDEMGILWTAVAEAIGEDEAGAEEASKA